MVNVIAGDRDLHTTLGESMALFQAANEPKRLVVFPDAAHEDLLQQNPQRYQEEIVPFLDLHLRPTDVSE